MDIQEEPANFSGNVRKPGIAWLENLGIKQGDLFPPDKNWKKLWQNCLGDLHKVYQGVCAYSGVHIERVAGARTVEHFKPKKKYPHLAYEWSNYRLVCSLLNGRKREYEDVLDPFTLKPETFFIEFSSGKIYPNPMLPAHETALANSTILRLGLDDQECRNLRTRYYDAFRENPTIGGFLSKQFPFVWYEIQRQKLT